MTKNNFLQNFFGSTGPLSEVLSQYQIREDQVNMALAVNEAIQTNSSLIVEAGTDIGKTFAYLVPALSNGKKVVISTATKNLQDQLFLKDLPIIRNALKIPVEVSVLKGRANYICQFRLENALQEGQFLNREDAKSVQTIKIFADHSKSGEVSEVQDVAENSLLWPMVTSTNENCLGTSCDYAKNCFFLKARKKALTAEVIIVNHHLFFADFILKDEEISEILPTANTVIFDEAHQVPDIASFFLGNSFSTNQVLQLLQDLQQMSIKLSIDSGFLIQINKEIIEKIETLQSIFPKNNERLLFNKIEQKDNTLEILTALLEHLNQLYIFFEAINETGAEFKKNLERLKNLHYEISMWLSKRGEENIFWLEIFSRSMQFNITPLSIAEKFKEFRDANDMSWIFTSATLTVDEKFDHFQTTMGLEDATLEKFNSPFDYKKNSLLYVPEGMPEPNETSFNLSLVKKVLPLIKTLKGRTFILSTSLKGVAEISSFLKDELEKDSLHIPVLTQGDESRQTLIQRFVADGFSILIGSLSFWEGVDVRGSSLSMVIIDKLPFHSPGDPIFESKINYYKNQGLNAFIKYQVPQAVIQLKQGSGRFIRDENDLGVLVITDPRLITRSYGKKFWQSLPPYKRTRDENEVIEFLKRL